MKSVMKVDAMTTDWLESLPHEIRVYALANIELLQHKYGCDEHDAAQLTRWRMINGAVRLPRIEVHQHPDGTWPKVWWAGKVTWVPNA